MAVDYMGSLIDPLAKVQQGQDYVNKIAAYSTKLQAGRQYAAGDYRGASQTQARGGDIAGANATMQSEADRLTAQQAYIKQALPVFQAALQRGGPEAVVNAYQQIAPDLKRIGMTDEQIAQFGQRLQADPQGTIQALVPIASQEVEYRQMGQEVGAFDKRGNLIRRFGPSSVTLSQGQSTFPNPDSGGPGIDPTQPQPTGGAPPPPAAAVGGAAAAQMPAAPVPVPVPQTAAAPVVAPSPVRPAAGAVQPSIRPGAMPGATQPPRDPRTGAVPPLSAPASAGPEYAADLPSSPSRATSQFAANTVQPEGVRPILSNPRPQFRPATNEDRQRQPGLVGFKPDGTPVFRKDAATELRREFQGRPEIKTFGQISGSYDKLYRLSRAPQTAATDMAMVFGYMKILDADSVVREGEYATVKNAAGVPERVRNWYNGAIDGRILGKAQREEIVGAASQLYASEKATYDHLAAQYDGLARQAGVDPAKVVLPRRTVGGTAQTPRDPFPGIKEGERVRQGGVTYIRRGDQMVEVR